MSTLDPRLTPARPDLAASHLAGKVEAARFVDGELREVVAPQAPLRRDPSPDAPLDTEALRGERVTVYETTEEGWAWGQLADDGYVGWLPAEALRAPGPTATHKVAVPRTIVFPGPSIKLPPAETLAFGSRIAVTRFEGTLAVTAGGCIAAAHLAPLDARTSDPVVVAETFLHAPYLWGGKTNLGLDCSALVQISLTACGLRCPRDGDMQERALGTEVAPENLRRGDLVFWPGHVAIVRDGTTLIHANAHHMAVAIEPIADAIARIRAVSGEVSAVKRIGQTA
jgi:cell wall-associated NlpC family hydrolase